MTIKQIEAINGGILVLSNTGKLYLCAWSLETGELESKKELQTPFQEAKKAKEDNRMRLGEAGLVRMSHDEHQKLIDEYGQRITADFVERLHNYIGSKGDPYKNHYLTIKNWMKKDNITKDDKNKRRIIREI